MGSNAERITRREFYARGGFSNPQLFRRQMSNGAWGYFRRID